MKRALWGFVLLLSVSLSAQIDIKVDIKKELERLQGNWALTSAAGQALPAGSHVGLVFAGDTYQGSTNGTIDERGSIKLDPTTKPISIDLVITEGTEAGKTQLGLVEITGDTMTLILAEPGSTVRPSTSSQDKLTLARVKPLAKDFEGTWEGTLDAGG